MLSDLTPHLELKLCKAHSEYDTSQFTQTKKSAKREIEMHSAC